MKSKQIVICIPVYKKKLSPLEEISLIQLNRILGKYRRVFVAPESLQFDYGSLGKDIGTERFADYFFKSIKGYSHLMLDISFYRRFAEYEYMLIYQTDAFVFKDELADFCALGYDYIGAPLERFHPLWHALGTQVGNGGFSLRRISSAMRVLNDWFANPMEHPLQNFFWQAEDAFWGYCACSSHIDFTAAPVAMARRFALQDDVGHGFSKITCGTYPFGCHGWYKDNFSFWREYIESYGYKLPVVPTSEIRKRATLRALDYLESRGKVNIYILWGDMRHGRFLELREKLVNYLAHFPVGDAAWQGKAESLAYLWLQIENATVEHGMKLKVLLPLSQALRCAVKCELTADRWYVLFTIAPFVARYDYEEMQLLYREICAGYWRMWEAGAQYTLPQKKGGRKILVAVEARDERYIIESFVRHTLTFADEIILHIAWSSDGVKDLLMKLCREGLPLTLIEEGESWPTCEREGEMINLEPYDFLLPGEMGASVRTSLQALTYNSAYIVPVYQYVTAEDVFTDKFILARPLLRSLQPVGSYRIHGNGDGGMQMLPIHIARFDASPLAGRYKGQIPANMEFVDISRIISDCHMEFF